MIVEDVLKEKNQEIERQKEIITAASEPDDNLNNSYLDENMTYEDLVSTYFCLTVFRWNWSGWKLNSKRTTSSSSAIRTVQRHVNRRIHSVCLEIQVEKSAKSSPNKQSQVKEAENRIKEAKRFMADVKTL